MSIKRIKLLLMICVGVFAWNSSAAQNLAWDEFVDSCTNPEKYRSQVPPTDITVLCSDVNYVWMLGVPQEQRLPSARAITVGVHSNKYQVEAQTVNVDSPSSLDLCNRYEETKQTFQIAQKVSCAEVQGFADDLVGYCKAHLDLNMAANPDLVVSEKTGRTVGGCSKSSPTGYKPEGQK